MIKKIANIIAETVIKILAAEIEHNGQIVFQKIDEYIADREAWELQTTQLLTHICAHIVAVENILKEVVVEEIPSEPTEGDEKTE